MLTFQDLLKVGDNEQNRMAFVLTAISQHESSELYKIAADAELYYRHLNPTIMRAEKIVYDVLGRANLDQLAANHKIPCRYYYYFINQAVAFLLGNGVSFQDRKTKDRLGGVMFDHVLQDVATKALNAGVAFGFLNVDHVELLPVCGGPGEVSFVPLFDEENGALSAGIRYWQIDESKPLRATLFEIDGFTEYIRRRGQNIEVLYDKRPYKLKIASSEVSGSEIINGENWATFPIVPLYNTSRQSELIGGKATLDSYDLMLSQLVNNVDEGALIYWIIQNADGMTMADDQEFVERLRTIRVAHTNDGQAITPQMVDVPFQASEASLERLRNQLFEDFMALDVRNIAGGAATATQIEAAYEPMNIKSSMLERQVTEFIMGLLKLLGIDDAPTYQRDTIVNKAEEVQTVLMAANNLSDEYVTRKILTILGDVDSVEDVMKERLAEDVSRYALQREEQQNNPAEQNENEEQNAE